MVVDALRPGGGKAVASSLPDGGPTALVLVVGGHVADAGVQSHGVVLHPHELEFGPQHGGVLDEIEVGPVGFNNSDTPRTGMSGTVGPSSSLVHQQGGRPCSS